MDEKDKCVLSYYVQIIIYFFNIPSPNILSESAAVSETARVENVNVLRVSTEKSVNAVTGTVALTMVCCVVVSFDLELI